MINTTHGPLDETSLARTVGFEDRPNEFVVWVEWRLLGHDADACVVCANPNNPKAERDIVLVRRDAHCILKEPSVIAEAIAAEF